MRAFAVRVHSRDEMCSVPDVWERQFQKILKDLDRPGFQTASSVYTLGTSGSIVCYDEKMYYRLGNRRLEDEQEDRHVLDLTMEGIDHALLVKLFADHYHPKPGMSIVVRIEGVLRDVTILSVARAVVRFTYSGDDTIVAMNLSSHKKEWWYKDWDVIPKDDAVEDADADAGADEDIAARAEPDEPVTAHDWVMYSLNKHGGAATKKEILNDVFKEAHVTKVERVLCDGLMATQGMFKLDKSDRVTLTASGKQKLAPGTPSKKRKRSDVREEPGNLATFTVLSRF